MSRCTGLERPELACGCTPAIFGYRGMYVLHPHVDIGSPVDWTCSVRYLSAPAKKLVGRHRRLPALMLPAYSAAAICRMEGRQQVDLPAYDAGLVSPDGRIGVISDGA